MKIRINIIVDNDKCWLLNTIRRLIPLLEKNNFRVYTIWVLPNKLSNLKGNDISLWYLRIFGCFNFIKLCLFYLVVIISNLIRNLNSFSKLIKDTNIELYNIMNLEDKRLLKYLKKNPKNYNLIFTNHIIPKKLLNLKNNYFINKHSSLLPSFKGLLPYIRTKISKSYNGITIHIVNEKIDDGVILFQKKIQDNNKSMIEFYLNTFNKTPKYIIKSLYNLKKKKFYKSNYKPSKFSLPSKKDFKIFLNCGGRIINIKDFIRIKKIII